MHPLASSSAPFSLFFFGDSWYIMKWIKTGHVTFYFCTFRVSFSTVNREGHQTECNSNNTVKWAALFHTWTGRTKFSQVKTFDFLLSQKSLPVREMYIGLLRQNITAGWLRALSWTVISDQSWWRRRLVHPVWRPSGSCEFPWWMNWREGSTRCWTPCCSRSSSVGMTVRRCCAFQGPGPEPGKFWISWSAKARRRQAFFCHSGISSKRQLRMAPETNVSL